MKNNKTPVEWLIEQLSAPCRGIPSHIIEQAVEMQKELIMYTYSDGWEDAWEIYSEKVKIQAKSMEEYYNEKYAKK